MKNKIYENENVIARKFHNVKMKTIFYFEIIEYQLLWPYLHLIRSCGQCWIFACHYRIPRVSNRVCVRHAPRVEWDVRALFTEFQVVYMYFLSSLKASLNFKRTKRNTPVTNMTWKYNFVKLTLRNVKFNTSNQKLSKLRHEEQNSWKWKCSCYKISYEKMKTILYFERIEYQFLLFFKRAR